jgi:hypothetical protein
VRRSGAAFRFFVLLTLLLTAALGAAAEEDKDLEGLPIVAIHFDRHDIFDTSDPQTDAWFYRWANALHIVSKEQFLRSMLLFEEGDPYSASAAAESARILRSLGIINPVEITATRSDDGVEVWVETHDRWSLQISGQAGLTGNRSSFGIDFEEQNLFGWGKAVAVAFESDDERTAWSYRYFDPNLFRSRWRLNLVHSELSDGSRDELLIDRPFYSLATRWSWGLAAGQEELVSYLYSRSDKVVNGTRDSERLRLWGGARLPGDGHVTRRLTAGWEYWREDFSDWQWQDTGRPYPSPENLLIEGPSVGYERISDRFIVVEGFRAWTVQEDVALGPNFSVSTVFSSPGTGGDQRRLVFEADGRAARRSGQWLLLGDVWISGRHEAPGARNLVAGLQLGAAQLGPTGWQLRLLAETSHELDGHRQLTLGADMGLRGWDPDFFDGTGRALFNAQWRHLILRDVLQLFSLGIVVFGDAGMTWDPRVGADTDGVRFDAGVGLLFDLTHLSRTNLLRVDLAFPDDGSGPTITVSTSTIFRLRRSAYN